MPNEPLTKLQIANAFERAYCPFYCEENIWHLCRESNFENEDASVVVISNPERGVFFWGQRAAADAGFPVLLDYHVVLLHREATWMIYDFDSTANFPIAADDYLEHTFPQRDKVSGGFSPMFRIIARDEYAEGFTSDRSHHKDDTGTWSSPMPDWPCIGGNRTNTFPELITTNKGDVVSLGNLHRRLFD
jgi:protein N-terminal glutamine amidohydrolase